MNKKLEHDLNKEKGVVGKMITLFCNSPLHQKPGKPVFLSSPAAFFRLLFRSLVFLFEKLKIFLEKKVVS